MWSWPGLQVGLGPLVMGVDAGVAALNGDQGAFVQALQKEMVVEDKSL